MMVVMLVFDGTSTRRTKEWRDLLNIVLGVWFMASPWTLGFATHIPARSTTVVAGFLIVVLALCALVLDVDMRPWLHHRRSAH